MGIDRLRQGDEAEKQHQIHGLKFGNEPSLFFIYFSQMIVYFSVELIKVSVLRLIKV